MRHRNSLADGVHLLLVDVHRRPVSFSFADALAESVGVGQPPLPSPLAVAYCVGEPMPKGYFAEVWRRPLVVGADIPLMPLPLSVHQNILVDLESTYRRDRRAYLE